jgi:glycine/D-amino acid oxidase-like deaminating enzyme
VECPRKRRGSRGLFRRRLQCLGGAADVHVHLIGFGLAGAGLAFFLCQRAARDQRVTLSVVDAAGNGCGGGATQASAGILHPFTPRARKIWLGDEGLACAKEILRVIHEPDAPPIARRSGLFRIASTEREANDYATAAAELYPKELYWDRNRDRLYIPDAWVVDAPAYVQRVRSYLERYHAEKLTLWESRQVHSLHDEWQRIQAQTGISRARESYFIVAAGASSRLLIPTLPLTWCGGHNLVYRRQDWIWPTVDASMTSVTSAVNLDVSTLDVPVIGGGSYLVPLPDGARVIGGATKEYGLTRAELLEAQSRAPTEQMSRARAALDTPLVTLFARYANTAAWSPAGSSSATVPYQLPIPIEALYGVRALPPRNALGAVPLVGEVPSEALSNASISERVRVLYFTGLGSRGLIHHGIIGRLAAEAVLRGDPLVSLASVASPSVLASVRRDASEAVAAS